MFRRIRHTLTLLALVALVGISLGAVGQSIAMRWQAPPADSFAELRDRLKHDDLTQLPLAEKKVLAKRVEREMRRSFDPQHEASSLLPDERMRFERNIGDLLAVWLRAKIDEYFALPANERDEFLDDEMDRLSQWKQKEGENRGISVYMPLLEQLNRQYQTADGEERKRLGQFRLDVQRRIMARTLSGFQPQQAGQGRRNRKRNPD